MKGVIAAGSQPTVDAGAEMLEDGGNAVDAVVAGCLATAVGEPTLTSLAGGGIMLHRDGGSGECTICDFFANAPGLGLEQQPELDFFGVELDFGPATQTFHIGAGSAAVPGIIPGLFTALERWGKLPLSRVVEPACRMLRDGFVFEDWQARGAALLEPILLYSKRGTELYTRGDRFIAKGDRFVCPELADTLEALAEGDWRRVYRDDIGGAMLQQYGPQSGGLLTPQDLDRYEVDFHAPLGSNYRDAVLFTNPPPAVGGEFIALMLSLLETLDNRLEPGSYLHLHALARAMRVADEARRSGNMLDRPGRWRARYEELAGKPLGAELTESTGPNSTTHVSVIDGDGNAAAVTFSYGEGNGSLIGHTGIMMNNLMGEDDLFPDGFHQWPVGTRLSTMMAPTLVVSPQGDISVLGTGGANRIRTAITQVVHYLFDFGFSAEEAVSAARVHFESGVLNVETFDLADGGSRLEQLGAEEVVRFAKPNLFFGGVHMVHRRADGVLYGAGDPRRGGLSRVVE